MHDLDCNVESSPRQQPAVVAATGCAVAVPVAALAAPASNLHTADPFAHSQNYQVPVQVRQYSCASLH